MRAPALVVLVCSLAVMTACSTRPSARVEGAREQVARLNDFRESTWGEMPCYQNVGPMNMDRGAIADIPVEEDTSLVAEVLVDRQGRVREVAITQSSGVPSVDGAVKTVLLAGRYAIPIPASEPAPYVERVVLQLHRPGASHRSLHAGN